jgi:hypothetical protein
VPDIVAKLGQDGIGAGALETELSARQRKESRDLPQQARLAGAVRAAHEQGLARRKFEIEVLEDDPAAALAEEVMGGEADRSRHLLSFCAG